MSVGHRGRMCRVPAAAAVAILAACNNTDYSTPQYEAFEVTRHDDPTHAFRFSAGNATPEWPIMMTVQGREIDPSESGDRMSLQRLWIADHVPKSATLVSMGTAKCGPATLRHWPPPLPPEPHIPYCDVMDIQIPGRDEPVGFFFYIGNWPNFRDIGKPAQSP